MSSWLNPVSVMVGVLFVATCAYLVGGVPRERRAPRREQRPRALLHDARARLRSRDGSAGRGRHRRSPRRRPLPVRRPDARGTAARDPVRRCAGSERSSLLRRGARRGARPLAVGAVVAVVWGWGVAQYPYLLPQKLTIADGAATSATLTAVLIVFGVAVVARAAVDRAALHAHPAEPDRGDARRRAGRHEHLLDHRLRGGGSRDDRARGSRRGRPAGSVRSRREPRAPLAQAGWPRAARAERRPRVPTASAGPRWAFPCCIPGPTGSAGPRSSWTAPRCRCRATLGSSLAITTACRSTGRCPVSCEWDVVEATADEDRARLRARLEWDPAHEAFPAVPVPPPARVRGTAHGGVDRDHASRSLRPGDGSLPVSFGFHPYLRIPGGSRADARMTLPVRRRLVHDDVDDSHRERASPSSRAPARSATASGTTASPELVAPAALPAHRPRAASCRSPSGAAIPSLRCTRPRTATSCASSR